MAIENVLIEGDGGITAVCCTSGLTLQVLTAQQLIVRSPSNKTISAGHKQLPRASEAPG